MSEEGDVSLDLQESVLFIKRFHLDASPRARNVLQIIREMLDRLMRVLDGWQQLPAPDRQAVEQCISQQIFESIKLLGTVNYRGNLRLQLDLVVLAATCGFKMLRVGLIECFAKILLYMYPIHDSKVHDTLLFFQNPDINQSENFPKVQLRVAEVALRDNFCVPWAVLIYMNDFVSDGGLQLVLDEFEREGISSSRGFDLLSFLTRLLIIVPNSDLSRIKEYVMRVLNGAISADGRDLRKIDKNSLEHAFTHVIKIDSHLKLVSVNELGLVGLSLLKSSLLDKRIVGSACLNSLCAFCLQVGDDSNAVELRNLLISNGILELLFGPSMHGAVSKFKRCNHIVRLIFEDCGSKVAATPEASFLWHSLFDRHSDMFEPCFEAFQHAILFCSEQILVDCLQEILSTNDELMNLRPRTLSLLSDILDRDSLDSVVKKKIIHSISEYLLNLQLVRCDEPAFSELVMHANSLLFGHALKGSDVSSLFKRVCSQCVLVLHNPDSTSCKILDFLLEFYTKTCVDSCEPELTIILGHVLDALSSHQLPDGYSSSLFTFLSHSAGVHLIGPAHEDRLWCALAIGTADEVRRQQAFEFILHSKNLSIDVQRTILEIRLPQLPVSCMSLKALECLFYLINSVNAPQNQTQVGVKRVRADSLDFTMASNIIGLDTLWKFCLSCPDANILQLAVGKFSSYVIESCSAHPGSFTSVVQNCVNELRLVGSDAIKARNIISLMLDMSRSSGAIVTVSHERYFPLGHIVQQPTVSVIVGSVQESFSEFYMYCSPVKTIEQFRVDLALRLGSLLSFEVLFQISKSDGSRDYVRIDDQTNYLGRYGSVISCKISLNSSDQVASGASRVSLRVNHNLQQGKQKKVSRPICEMPRVPMPPILLPTVASNVTGGPKQGPPVVRIPFDDVVLQSHESDSECILCEPPSQPTELSGLSGNQDSDHSAKQIIHFEPPHCHPWSIFTENTENYQVLFDLGSKFPDLNAPIWELLLLLPLNVEFIHRTLESASQPQMFFDLKSTLEKIYFLSCVTFWKDLPAFCFDGQLGFQNFFSSVAVAALDTTDALQCSASIATASRAPSVDMEGQFGLLILSYHLNAIAAFRRETGSHPNWNCISYTLVLLSAGIISLSNGDVADTLDSFIESLLNRFEADFERKSHVSGSGYMLSTAATCIIEPFLLSQVNLLLNPFFEIPSSRRLAITRLLLSSLSSHNLSVLQSTTMVVTNCICKFLSVLMSSSHQCDFLDCTVEFIQKDSVMFSKNVSFMWLQIILQNTVSKHESTSVQFLLKKSVQVAAGICKYTEAAKRDFVVRAFHIQCHFIAAKCILQLLPPLQNRPSDVVSDTLEQQFIDHFREILLTSAFPQEVCLPSTDAHHDLRMNVSYPRPPSLVLMSPLVTNEDHLNVNFCNFVHVAAHTLRGVCTVVFDTFLQQSASMLLIPIRKVRPSIPSSNISSYQGLINLGCTCYFNSVTQQLFMLPGFAASVIAAQVKVNAAEAAVNSGQMTSDASKPEPGDVNALARGILETFQDLMIHLRHSAGSVVHPHFFCESFRFPDGGCILPDVQQDALEFFHILCDHLDNALKGGEDEKLLSRFFGGRSATQLICKGCPHRYERFEHFFTLQLAVFSNRANSVLGALQEFVAGELLEGDNQYFCSSCHKKVDTVKRTVLADLPDTIILGLKRFDFNYDSMQRIKLNVEVPFDHDLDMSPFCRENMGETPEDSEPAIKRERGYYEYSLVGIVVHSGMADSGHYFSIIRDQFGRWHKFNDDVVLPIQQLELKQYFGGQSHGKSVHTNAYILVYHRKVSMFQHQYSKITSIENALPNVQNLQKLSMDMMFVNSLRSKFLCSTFSTCITLALSASVTGDMEISYVNFLLKLSQSSQNAEIVESYLQPLLVSLQEASKCNTILEHVFSKFKDPLEVHEFFFRPIADMEPRQTPLLPAVFTQLILTIIANAKQGLYTSCEPVICQHILSSIVHFCGNLSCSAYKLLENQNPLDVQPDLVPKAYAVVLFLKNAIDCGLIDVLDAYFSLDQPCDEKVSDGVTTMCYTFMHYASVSELGSQLKSKRRAYLRKYVHEFRYGACWSFWRLFNYYSSDENRHFFEEQSTHHLQTFASSIVHDNADLFFTYLKIHPTPSRLAKEIEQMSHDAVLKIVNSMPNLLHSIFEGLSHFARSFCDPPLSFSIQPMISLLKGVLLQMLDGGHESRLPQFLHLIYVAVVEGYAQCMNDADTDPPYHSYRMLIVVVFAECLIRQDAPHLQSLQDYVAASPCPPWNQQRMLFQALDSRDHPPCFDDGLMYSSEAGRGETSFFVPILNLLRAGASRGEDGAAAAVAES